MRAYYQIPPEALGENARIPLRCLESSQAVFQAMAREMACAVRANNSAGRRTVFIVPVGPVGQYPFFVQAVNEERISLKDCWFFNMDEYMLDEKTLVPRDFPRSFVAFMETRVYGRIDPALAPPPEQRVFPDPADPARGDALLERLGGADICFGGIGINGHLAFNEPQPGLTAGEFRALPSRVLPIALETIAANAIGDMGGNLEDMPRWCVTIGFKQIYSARKVRLGVFRDWHRAVVRRAAYGEMTPAFPASLLQSHPDALIYVNDNAARRPDLP